MAAVNSDTLRDTERHVIQWTTQQLADDTDVNEWLAADIEDHQALTDEEIISLIQQTRDDDFDKNEEADDPVPRISHAEAARAFELPLAYVEPVSYTHLMSVRDAILYLQWESQDELEVQPEQQSTYEEVYRHTHSIWCEAWQLVNRTCSRIRPEDTEDTTTGPEAVSYTHLDVYKRQLI